MISSRLPFLCLLLVIGAWSEDAPLKEQFTTKLLKELAKDGGNVVFSPTSMDSALSIVGFGAKGQTEQELYSGLGYNPADARQVITAKQQKLNEAPAPGAIWNSANRILVAPDLPLRKDYLNDVAQSFPGVAVTHFDFATPEKTANEVNEWVSEKTNKVIQKLLEPDSLNPQVRMIVVNAVYFKGQWEKGFDKSKTKKECFYPTPGQCEMTDMMHTKQDYKYGFHTDMKAQIIELPYKNSNYSMIIVLPDEKESSIGALIDNLNVDEIINFIDKRGWSVEVHLTLPKFEIEFKRQMKKPLQKIGIQSLFSDSADLSGMVSGLRARVDSVIHKAKITCDEEGTVAAAGTGIQIIPISAVLTPDPINYFIANRPFLYMIRNKGSGIIFSGVFSKVNEN